MNLVSKFMIPIFGNLLFIGVAIAQQSTGDSPMSVYSNSFKHNTAIPQEYVYEKCGGQNISPDIKWTNFPANTKSFALIMHDPDAPRVNGFYHWLVINIPTNTTGFEKGQKIQNATELQSDFQTLGYGGPCPPSGQHRYNFTVYALDTESLKISKEATPKEIETEIKKHAIGQGTLTGLYKR